MEDNRKNILEVKNLHTYFYTDSGVVKSVDGVDFELKEGSTLGIVGESGSWEDVLSVGAVGVDGGFCGGCGSGTAQGRKGVAGKGAERPDPGMAGMGGGAEGSVRGVQCPSGDKEFWLAV